MPPASDPAMLARHLLHYARPRQMLLVVRMAELGTIQKAAAALGMSQPSATQALTRFETLLGVKLFDRHARGIRPTREGLLLMPAMRRSLASFEALAQDAANAGRGANGLVRIAGIFAASTAVVAPALSALCAVHPELWVEYREIDAAQIPSLCSERSVDLLLCRTLAAIPAGYEFMALLPDRWGIYSAQDHPLVARRSLTLRHCANATWLLPPADSPPHQAFMSWCRQQDVVPRLARISTRALAVSIALVRRLQYLYVGLDSLLGPFVETGQLQRLPLAVPGALDDIGLLFPSGTSSGGVQLAVQHLVHWAAH